MADAVKSKPDSFHDEGLGQGEPSIKLSKTQTDDRPIEDEQFKQTSRRIVRKLDFTLMPIIWLLYLFNYLDRTAIAYVFSIQSVRLALIWGIVRRN